MERASHRLISPTQKTEDILRIARALMRENGVAVLSFNEIARRLRVQPPSLYPRDQWVHRYDLCAATGKPMVVTPEHDGRITVLVVRDIVRKCRKEWGQRGVLVQLAGRLVGEYQFGSASAPACTLVADTIFMIWDKFCATQSR